MRSKKALLNTIAGLLYEFTAVACGLVLPRLILLSFGSDYNGITSAISQFLGYVALMKAGIGGVTKAALYKPLATGDTCGISAVVNATDEFLKRVAAIFGVSLILFASIYPAFVRENFDWFFTFSLVLIIGISTFAQYFFGLTYQLLLNADQRQCVISFIQIGTTVLNTVIAAILIKANATIHVVKLASSLVFCLNPLAINLYARRRYRIDRCVAADREAIKDRWDCFGLQVANFVNSNTDMFILTVFTNVFEVSVYTVYHMVISGIQKVMRAFVNGIGAAFGNMFAKGEDKVIKRDLYLYEEVTFAIANVLFGVTLVMIESFVSIYTRNVTDVNYQRPLFASIYVFAALFGVYRIPYQSIVEAVGHFKQTRNGAFFEAFMNLIVSVAMVIRFGLVGVAVGTLCATVFRTFQYAAYMSKHVIRRSIWPLVKRLFISAGQFVLLVILVRLLHLATPETYLQWTGQSILVFVVMLVLSLGTEYLFYHDDLELLIVKLKGIAMRDKPKV